MVSISGYYILEQLYDGSRTLVYRGIRENDRKPVVIKLLKNPYPSFSELVQFRNQYTISKNLNYPGIIQTYSLESYQNSYALIMEDIGGISLKEYFQNITSLQQFLQISISLCDTLDILYHHRVIHKDIKPANILINPETKQVKLIDFSIASLLPRETQTLINPNVLEGTLSYISPEQTGRMNRGIDYRTDFYSLGVTFYELLTGELPFKSDDAMELVHCHIAKMPPSVNSYQLSVNSEETIQVLSDIVMKLMAKNAEDRYQSALGLKHDLEVCLKQLQETGDIKYFEIAQRDICDRFTIPEKLYGRENEVEQLLAAFNRVAGVTSRSLALTGNADSEAEPLNSRSLALPGNAYPKALPSDLLEAEPAKMHYKAEPCNEGNKPEPCNEGNKPEPCNEGKTELMLIAGFSGIGKTALVNEVHKPIVKQRGYFIKGKFDQFNRNIPYFALVQAFQELIKQLLSESDAQLSIWKDKILQALGVQAQVIIDVIPELEQIIGKQPPAPELSGSAAQNRFNLLFQKFIQVFTTKEHPLVILLDDLQWADSASLKLMQLLMGESETDYLLLIGAYRDNEVFPAHPLMATLEEIRKSSATINSIKLTPLSQSSLNQLVADTLYCNEEIAQPLTQLVYQKTKGNPFFSTQFLKSLHEDGLIKFHPALSSFNKGRSQGGWECDITKIIALTLTDNVVEFMALRLQKLPEATQNLLKLAACIGNQFDLATLAIVCEQSSDETATDLWKALQEGLILPQSETYKFYLEKTQIESVSQAINYRFLHDRVQQAAYSLIPETQKQKTHLQIGRLFWQNIPQVEQEEKIFDIVNQFNLGIELITQSSEQEELAKLNLIAAHKAKVSTAYSAANEYLTTGINLLLINSWEHQYDLSLSLYEKAAEVAYLNGDFVGANDWANIILQQAKVILDKIKAYEVIIQTQIAQVKLPEAVKLGLQVLNLLGMELPESPKPLDTQQAMQEVTSYLQGKNISDLINLPVMCDADKLAAMRILSIILFPSGACVPALFPLTILKQVNLSIKYGNSSFSTFAYAAYGLILQAFVQDTESSYQFGQLALNLVEKLNASEMKTKTFFMAALSTKHGKEHIQRFLPLFEQAYQSGIDNGDLEYASHAAMNRFQHAYFASRELTSLKKEAVSIATNLIKFKQATIINQYKTVQQAILNLIHNSEQPYRLIGEVYNESEILPLKLAANDRIGLYLLYIHKLILCYLFGEYSQALQNSKQTEIYLDGVPGCLYESMFYFYDSLVLLSLDWECAEVEKTSFLEKVKANQNKLESLANHAPMNYQHKYDLVEAEKYRILGQKIEAIELYDKAISGAKVNKYIQEEALANELVAKFYLDWNKEKVAATYMQEAYYCYAKWGAKAKTDDLEKRYPQLLEPILQAQNYNSQINETYIQPIDKSFLNQTIQTSRSSSSVSEALDFASILKATRAISSEIELKELISTLLQIVIENSGAEKAALIFRQDNVLNLEAIATKDNGVTLLSIPYETSEDIPQTLINYVKRSLKTVVLDNATVQNDFISDEYLIQQKPYSLLCTPILNQTKLVGLLYLENKLTIGVFTRQRLEVINLLCTQAAISLENACLYAHRKQAQATVTQKSQELEKTLQELQQAQLQMVQNEKMATLGNLVAGVAHEVNNPIGFLKGSISNAEDYIKDLFAHIECYQENYPTPEEEVIESAEDIDLEFLTQDLPKLLDSMKVATNRIKDISTSLRTFSRADTAEKIACNIHEGIDSTILILKYRLKANDKRPAIKVIKEYGNLPPVKCFLGQLNQVFMNIIANAIDALDMTNEGKTFAEIEANPHKITINTELSTEKNTIIINIEDNGSGMPKSIQERIFDNLFTTKGVGKGTGLGLAIAKQIVEEIHGGKISCNSTLGKGTEFIIELPINEF